MQNIHHIITFCLLGTVISFDAFAGTSNFQDKVEKDKRTLRKLQIKNKEIDPQKKLLLDRKAQRQKTRLLAKQAADSFVLVDGTLRAEETEMYYKYRSFTDKKWEEVGDAGTLHPDAEGAQFQKAVRKTVAAGKVVYDMVYPFVETTVIIEALDAGFKYITPYVLRYGKDENERAQITAQMVRVERFVTTYYSEIYNAIGIGTSYTWRAARYIGSGISSWFGGNRVHPQSKAS